MEESVNKGWHFSLIPFRCSSRSCSKLAGTLPGTGCLLPIAVLQMPSSSTQGPDLLQTLSFLPSGSTIIRHSTTTSFGTPFYSRAPGFVPSAARRHCLFTDADQESKSGYLRMKLK